MYYPDLSPYEHSNLDRHVALNVGWLDAAHPFPTGQVPATFAERLRSIEIYVGNITLGSHVCEFCHFGPAPPGATEVELIQTLYERAGKRDALGSAEIRVVARSGKIYVAPTLIHHYVIAHNYLPPEEFVDAVMELRIASSKPRWR